MGGRFAQWVETSDRRRRGAIGSGARHPGRNSLTADEGKESGLWWALVGSSCPMMVLAA